MIRAFRPIVRSSSTGGAGDATGSRSSVVDADPHPAGLERRPLAALLEGRDPALPAAASGSGPARRAARGAPPAAPGRRPPCRRRRRRLAPGRRASWASARATAASRDGAVTVSRSSALARRPDLVPDRVDEPLRLDPGRADRFVPLAARAAAFLVGRPQGVGRARLGGPGPLERLAGLALRLADPGERLLERPLVLGQPRACVGDDLRRRGPAARRSRTPGCRPAARSSAGMSATASRGRTRPTRSGPRRSCGRTPSARRSGSSPRRALRPG